MGLAAGLVGEHVEDAEGRRPHLDTEPGDRRRLLLHQGQTRTEEVGDLLLFPRLGLQSNVERELDHCPPPVSPCAGLIPSPYTICSTGNASSRASPFSTLTRYALASGREATTRWISSPRKWTAALLSRASPGAIS